MINSAPNKKYGLPSITYGSKEALESQDATDDSVSGLIPSSVYRAKMREYNHWNLKLESGSLSCLVLDTLYDAIKMTLQELHQATNGDVRMTIHRLRKKEMVTQNDDKTYSLTELGRWFTISTRLKLSFLELCLLACACCVQARYARDSKIGFYMRPAFDRIFGRFYTKKYISVVFSTLKKKGYAVKFSYKTIRVYPKTCEGLMSMYGEDFKGLERWLDSVEENQTVHCM